MTPDDHDLPGMWSRADFEGGDPDTRSYAQRERDKQTRLLAAFAEAEPCRFGFQEYDMGRYCFEHGGFLAYMVERTVCDRHPMRIEAQQ